MDPVDGGAVVALTAAGVTILVDVTGPAANAGGTGGVGTGGVGLPVIVHWGPELPPLDAAQARALIRAGGTVAGSNNVKPPPRVSVLPEHHIGWTGRPGLSGSAAGAGWSPAFTTTAIDLYGE